jgi:deoxyribose-phosphate aldolase
MVISVTDIDIAHYIDQAMLNPMATTKDIETCCHQAIQYNFPAVCVYPVLIRHLYG